MVREAEDVAQSLQILLGTLQGERIMQEDFGCKLDDYLFEEIDIRLLGGLKRTISRAIENYEPRINLDLLEVRLEENAPNGLLMIHLYYTILSSNSQFNLVYPFYLQEPQ